jgi:hypothetical protein
MAVRLAESKSALGFRGSRCDQDRGLEQAAEFFLAGAVMRAFAGLEVVHDLVPDFEALQMNDAEELLATFPNLALSKFLCHAVAAKGSVSPGFNPGETVGGEALLLLCSSLLANHSGLFLFGRAAGFGLFLAGFLLGGFR